MFNLLRKRRNEQKLFLIEEKSKIALYRNHVLVVRLIFVFPTRWHTCESRDSVF